MESQNSNLTCAICLERFRIPVTIPCGHTFCKNCITVHWDTKRQSDTGPQCPMCKEEFSTQPVLKRNVSLSVLTEAANSASCREPAMGGGDGARAMLLCDQHKKPLVYYCRQDKMSVCYECGILQCLNHEKVLLDTERENQELLLERKGNEVGSLLEETQKSVAELADNISQAQGIHPEPVSELVVQKPKTVGSDGLRSTLHKACTGPQPDPDMRASGSKLCQVQPQPLMAVLDGVSEME